MAAQDPMFVSYTERLDAVTAAVEAAEAERRFSDASSLRMAEQVLRRLIAEQHDR